MRKRIVEIIAGLAMGLGIPFAIGPSALAASAPSLGLQLTVDVSGSTVAYQAVTSASGSATHPVFQFWTNGGHGWHVAQHYSTNRQFELSSAQAQNTLVLVFALTQAEWKARDYQAAVYAMQVLNMGQVSMTLPYSPVVGTSYTLTASPYQIQDPVYQLWVQSPTGQWTSTNYQSSPTHEPCTALRQHANPRERTRGVAIPSVFHPSRTFHEYIYDAFTISYRYNVCQMEL